MSNLAVVHIVRRYGLVGGMESYVWELTHQLAELGVHVAVICESVFGTPSEKIQIRQIDPTTSKRRWKAMKIFRERVERLVSSGEFSSYIIHSHERFTVHHVTTFHGNLINVKKGSFLLWSALMRRLSPRIKNWYLMERDEICGPNVEFILPVSNQIKEQLIDRYETEVRNKNFVICNPGQQPLLEGIKYRHPLAHQPKKTIRALFVGFEWKRKGLPFALEIVKELDKEIPTSLTVYGPSPHQIPSGITRSRQITINGWTNKIPWQDYDLLIHPAVSEPFGMVIPEAIKHGIPVLSSKQVGAIDLELDGHYYLDLHDSVITWSETAKAICMCGKVQPTVKWTWMQLALLHINKIYPRVSLATQGAI